MGRARDAARRVLAVWCPDWPLGTPDSGPEAPAFEQVVAAVEKFCPRVEVVRPGTCAIGAAGPARYFGGEEALARKITDAVTALGFACRAGVADSLFAAQLAARVPAGAAARVPAGAAVQVPGRVALPWLIVAPGGTRAFLAPYPVSVLDVPEFADLLPRLGIWTLGDFAELPAAEAANRFGAPGRRAHRLARGLDARPLTPRQPSADLSVHIDFDPPANQAEPVVFAAKALAERMHAGLAARGLACVRVQAQATCADGRDITRLWRHDGILSALAVAERVRWQLDSWRTGRSPGGQNPDSRSPDSRSPGGRSPGGGSPGGGSPGGRSPGGRSPGGRSPGGRSPGEPDEAALTGGIVRLRLVPDQLVRDEGRQLGLWGDAVISDRVARAATRVQAMLGHEAVMRPVLAGGRDPAEQVTLIPFGDSGTPLLPAGRPWPGRIPAPAPATVYPVPLPARVTDDSGAAVTVTGRAVVSAPPARLSADGGPWLMVTAWAGPWPVAERWWTAAGARRRARFQLVTGDGSGWLAALQDGRWLIEASYD
jgi:protein ImuB